MESIINLFRSIAYWALLVLILALVGGSLLWLPLSSLFQSDLKNSHVEIVAVDDKGIYALSDGMICWSETIEVGDRVEAGQILGNIKTPQLDQKAEAIGLQCQQMARRCVEIQSELYRETDPGLREKLRQEYRMARNHWSDASTKKIQLERIQNECRQLIAPIDGWVTEIVTRTEGSVRENQLLMRIASQEKNDELSVEMTDSDFDQVRQGKFMKIEFSTPAKVLHCRAVLNPNRRPEYFWKQQTETERIWMCRLRATHRDLASAPGNQRATGRVWRRIRFGSRIPIGGGSGRQKNAWRPESGG